MRDAQPHASVTAPTPFAPVSVAPAQAERHMIVAEVRPRGAALERVFGLLRRRAPTLSALNVTASDAAGVIRVTLAFQATHAAADQVTEQMRKLVDVERAACFAATEANGAVIVREFALIRMANTPENRREIVDVARLFAARIVDVRDDSITLEASGPSSAIENILAMLRPLGIEEVVRSGGMAMRYDATSASQPEDEENGEFN